MVFVQSQKLKRLWEFFYTSFRSIYSLGSLLPHILMNLYSEIIILTHFGQQLHYVLDGNKEKLIWLMGFFVGEKVESPFQRHIFQSSTLLRKAHITGFNKSYLCLLWKFRHMQNNRIQKDIFEKAIKLLERDSALFSLSAPKPSTTLSFLTIASCNED